MVLEYNSGSITARQERSVRPLVRDVSFCLEKAKSLALIGETGSGKTMIALSVMGLLPRNVRMQGGSAVFCGEQLAEKALSGLLGIKIVYIPQNGLEFLSPSRTVRDHLYDSLKRLGIPRGLREEAASGKLLLAGLTSPEEVLGLYPFQLSGGMAQRVTIALAACSEAALIIADEPTNGLDEAARKRFMELLYHVFPDAAKIVITHDISLASLCDDVLVLCGGRMMEKGPSAEVLENPRSAYTRALIAARVKNGMKETPLLRQENGCCPFYRRCSAAGPRCLTEMEHGREGRTEWWCSQPC